MDLCYIFRRNAITNTALHEAEVLLNKFHNLRQFFVDAGVRASTSLPRQHALLHYLTSIPMFGSPNGLCSSITESKHIKAMKEPWRRSSRFNALPQMLRTVVRLDKLSALRRWFLKNGMLVGSTAGYTARLSWLGNGVAGDDVDSDNELEQEASQHDTGPEDGPRSLSSIQLASTPGIFLFFFIYILRNNN